MVTKHYLLDQPKPPSALKVRFDQQVIPAAINAAGSVEAGLERVAQRARKQPLAALGAAFGLAFLATRLAVPARVPASRRSWAGR